MRIVTTNRNQYVKQTRWFFATRKINRVQPLYGLYFETGVNMCVFCDYINCCYFSFMPISNKSGFHTIARIS